MKAYNFEYDGIQLKDLGFIICSFDSPGVETISNGTEFVSEVVSTFYGSKVEWVASSYDSTLETTIQICKRPKFNKGREISRYELRYIMDWLNRKDFHKFKIFQEEFYDIYFEAKFDSISRIEQGGKLYGLELTINTNRPFAIHEPKIYMLKGTTENWKKTLNDDSDEHGFFYPHMEIKIAQAGLLTINNKTDLEERTMVISNCVINEVITLDYPIITSSVPTHKIQNNFNWSFFRISNTFKSRKNNLTVSLPCTIKIVYSPIVKLSV